MATFVSKQISAGIRDGRFYVPSTYWYATGTYLTLSLDADIYLRFLDLPMNQGVTIDSAYLKIYTHAYGSSNSNNVTVKGIDEDNTAEFPSDGTSADPGSRVKTTATVSGWTIPGTRDVLSTSPDIKTIIQEIVDRPGWAGGNALGLVLDSSSAYSNDLWPYEYGSTKAAVLEITYTGTSTYQKTISAAANIINPTLDYGIVVMKPTYDVLTDKNPSHQVFNSDYGTLKYFVSGSVSIYLAAGYLAAVQSYEHNLGYIPFVEVYAETTTADRYQYAPYGGAGATVLYGVTYRVTSTHIYFYAESTGFAGDTTFNVKFFLFRNDLDL